MAVGQRWVERVIRENLVAVETRAFADANQLLLHLHELSIQAGAVVSRIGGIDRLHGELAHALQQVTHLAQRAFLGLAQRDLVIGVAQGHGLAADERRHAAGNGQAGGVVLGAVDAQARRQALH